MTNDTPTSTDDERDKETAARIREINLLLIDGKCTPEYAYERIEEIVKEQLNANQPQTDEVTPTPVGEFNYRPAVSVRSDNQPQTELERYHPGSCDKYEVLRGIYPNDRRLTGKDCSCGYKQAIIDWHNKQIEEVLDRLESDLMAKSYTNTPYETDRCDAKDVYDAIKAERNKLNNSDGDVK